MINKKKNRKTKRIKNRGTVDRPRVIFSQSNRFLRVQAVDDNEQHTLLFLSSEKMLDKTKGFSAKNKEYTLRLAKIFADQLLKKGYKRIVFDRNGNLFHGKVKIFCDTMRELGILF